MIFVFFLHSEIISPCSYRAPFFPPNLLYAQYIRFTYYQFPGCCCKRTWPILARNIPATESHVFFRLLRSYQRIIAGPRPIWPVRNMIPFTVRIVSTSPNSQDWKSSFVSCPVLLLEHIPSYFPYWRSFYHPQPEDAPCRSDRDPLIMDIWLCYLFFDVHVKLMSLKHHVSSCYFNLCYLQH